MTTRPALGHERVYTMRELSQDTSGVITAILKSGRPAFLTKRGQFIAAIQPLEPGMVEGRVADAIAELMGDGSPAGGHAQSTDFVAAMLGVNVDDVTSHD